MMWRAFDTAWERALEKPKCRTCGKRHPLGPCPTPLKTAPEVVVGPGTDPPAEVAIDTASGGSPEPSGLSEAERVRHREYQRKWRTANRERYNEYQRVYMRRRRRGADDLD